MSVFEEFIETTKHEYSQLIDSLTETIERLSSVRNNLNNLNLQPSQYESTDSQSAKTSDTSNLSIFTLGKFYIKSSNFLVDSWPNKRTESLFQLLLLHANSRLDNDYLIEELNLGGNIKTGLNSLRVTVHELRKILDKFKDSNDNPLIYITSEHGSYRLNFQENVWVDHVEFERVCSAITKPGYSLDEPEKASSILQLYKGDLFQERLYDDWIHIPRERLLDLYLNALWKLAEYFSNRDEPTLCIDFSRKLLERDFLNEGAYELIIKSYMDLRRYSSGLKWFEICEKHLRVELDIGPNNTLVNMALVMKGRIA
tara:strand:+ start:51 stop:989 length:939 start_codon:yes stop_codon:yes gene_type:complete